MPNEMRLIDANDVWSDIMMLPHNGDMISSEEVEQAIKDAPTVDAVEVDALKAWLYQIAINNTGVPVKDFSTACEEIISRLDGLRTFAGERREGE